MTARVARNIPKHAGAARALRRKEALVGLAFIMPSLAGIAVFVLIPFADAVCRSVTQGFTGVFVGFRYYTEIFNNASFKTALANTSRFMLLCVPLLLVISLAAAIMLSGKVHGRNALRAEFLTPMAIPVASVALLWQLLFHQNGLINVSLAALGLAKVDWMGSDASLFCLIISYIWKNIGYTMVLFIAGLSGISQSLYEAAAVDGAGPSRRFFSITLPCLLPTLFTVTVLSMLGTFKAYREAYLVAGSYPQGSIYLVQHTLNNWFSKLEIEKLSAAAVVIALMILALVFLLNKAWNRDRTA